MLLLGAVVVQGVQARSQLSAAVAVAVVVADAAAVVVVVVVVAAADATEMLCATGISIGNLQEK